jgi:Ni/Co efflux regulator RcnB
MMKTTIAALMIGMSLVPAAAFAQTRELNRDRQDVREERRELDRAIRNGDRREIRDERGDLREAKRELREDRQDWRGYRNSNPRLYSRGRWNAPFRYNRFNVGVRIAPNYYGQRYWIADPYRYRLARPYAGTRWVRHYDDVLLVNVRTGRVLQVNRGFYR